MFIHSQSLRLIRFNRIFFKGLSVVSSMNCLLAYYIQPTEPLFLYDNRHNFAAQLKMRTATAPCIKDTRSVRYVRNVNRLHHHLHYTPFKLIHKHTRQFLVHIQTNEVLSPFEHVHACDLRAFYFIVLVASAW